MKGFVGVTDNDWFDSSSQQALLPKTPCQSATKSADKNDDGQAYLNEYFYIPISVG